MIRLAIDTKSIYFEIANQIIQYAIDKYEMKILDYLYLSLTDHISFCVKRVLWCCDFKLLCEGNAKVKSKRI